MISRTFKNTLLTTGMLLPVMLSAQDAAPAASASNHLVLSDLVLIIGLVVLVAAIYTILRVFSMIIKLEEIRMLREKGLDEIAAHYAQPEKPMLTRIWNKLQGTVPISKEKEILFDHSYDGIHELDNKLPPWWVGLFYITIAIAVVYLYVYHVSDIGLSSAEKYEQEMEQAKADVAAYLATKADLVDETNVDKLTDEPDLAAGKEIFMTNCAVCHGQNGEGGVGPNMTDQYWIHGGDIKDLFRTIKYGVPEKGMISWSSQLRPAEMQKVASYILTLQGTNPPNQKEPQGNLWTPPTEAMVQDTTTAGD